MSKQGMTGMDLAAQEMLGIAETLADEQCTCQAARRDGR